MSKWQDVSRGDPPNVWKLRLGPMRVTVRTAPYYPTGWAVHCPPFFRWKDIDADTVEEAQAAALELVTQKLTEVVRALPLETTGAGVCPWCGVYR
ncbi:MAG: hypothetical protein GY832_16505 [Chloroflexi bacterium]|nr:hypothetical protein [Chloroflexota bacterium]